MERRALGIVAIILIGLMALVAAAGLDNLPRSVKKQVDAAGGLLVNDRQTLARDRSEFDKTLAEDPALFLKEADGWKARLGQDQTKLDAAAAKLEDLKRLAKANHRRDEADVERGLKEFNALREQALSDASAVQAEARSRIEFKHELPRRLQAMKAGYESLQSLDAGADAGQVRKAMTDWPAKREDLQSRLDALKNYKAQAQSVWDSSAELRAQAGKGNLADSQLETLSADAEQIGKIAKEAKEGLAADNTLASQLYTSWDKLLLAVDGRQQKVRIVRTRFPDATLAHGETTSEERSEPLDAALWRARGSEAPTGMVIERKPAGKYDSEAEHTVQAPGYAYLAPPGQSNSYGYWDGGVWRWLPEYLLLSQLLRSSREPIYLPDYDAYRYSRSRGEVFYGRNREYEPPRRPTGGWYAERGPASSGAGGFGGGGFSASPYRSRGAFSGSQYRSRGTFGSSGFGGGGGFRSYSRGRR
ncbi:MAG TPA: hypothetical protein VKV74_10235 [Bryobacteraceae bacterium]|nr:hypothetical protein [Bryobacteraceae bacterium]